MKSADDLRLGLQRSTVDAETAIVGGGLLSAALALSLRRLGVDVDVGLDGSAGGNSGRHRSW